MRYENSNDLSRAFNKVYVTHKGTVYYALTEGFRIHLQDNQGNTKHILDATKEFYLGMPNLGFVPSLVEGIGIVPSLVHISRNPGRQYSFGVATRSSLIRKYSVIKDKVVSKSMAADYLGGYFWSTLVADYKPFAKVLENGGGLSKEYGVTADGCLLFSNTLIGRVLPDKDGVALDVPYCYNSIIRDDLDKIGIKKVEKYEKAFGKEED